MSINRVKLKYQNDSVEIMQCTVKYITGTILVLPLYLLVLLFLPTLISSLSRRDCLPTLTGTFDNHIIGIYEIFLRRRAHAIFKGCLKGGCSSPYFKFTCRKWILGIIRYFFFLSAVQKKEYLVVFIFCKWIWNRALPGKINYYEIFMLAQTDASMKTWV